LLTSTNFGATWTKMTNTPFGYVRSIASSGDGSKLIVLDQSSYPFTSTNFGATWIQNTNDLPHNFNCVASSSDLTKLIATDGFFYTSTNFGVSWIKQTNTSSFFWTAIASSSDGSKVIAFNGNYGIFYTSTNFGVSWIVQTNAGSFDCTSLASNSDGSKIIASNGDDGYLYMSTNYGSSWSQLPQCPYDFDMSRIAASADGKKWFSFGQRYSNSQNYFFNLPNYFTQWSSKYVYGAAYSTIELIYNGSGLWIPGSYTGSSSSSGSFTFE